LNESIALEDQNGFDPGFLKAAAVNLFSSGKAAKDEG
jgi:hypothetical protein